jgi:4-nitrophenyl phosphatase
MTINMERFDPTSVKALILDMDGVLWRGSSPLGNLPKIFETINHLGLRFVMATNNASRSPSQYVKKLLKFGVNIKPWQIINSGIATAMYLKGRFPDGGNVFVVGEPALIESLEGEGFHHSGDNPLAVIAALDRTITYDKLTKAMLHIRAGALFIGTNPDRSFPIPEGEAPGAGAFLAALEAATGVSPLIIGKPQPLMYELASSRLGVSSEETLVVGDRLETDILGAQKGGFQCALVLSGVSTKEAAEKWHPAPNLIAFDLESLLTILS